MKFKIWTHNYRPFMMGGDVRAPIMAEVEVQGPIDVGKGYLVYVAISPNGKIFIAEGITGAIVGSSIPEVMKDIEEGDEEIMKQQIEEAKLWVKRAELTSEEKLWERLKGI